MIDAKDIGLIRLGFGDPCWNYIWPFNNGRSEGGGTQLQKFLKTPFCGVVFLWSVVFFGVDQGHWWRWLNHGGVFLCLGVGWLCVSSTLFLFYGRHGRRGITVFRGSPSSMEELLHLVVVWIAKWASFSLRVDGVLHNWEASLSCRVKKVKKWCIRFPPFKAS